MPEPNIALERMQTVFYLFIFIFFNFGWLEIVSDSA